jgi:hypothetical protein
MGIKKAIAAVCAVYSLAMFILAPQCQAKAKFVFEVLYTASWTTVVRLENGKYETYDRYDTWGERDFRAGRVVAVDPPKVTIVTGEKSNGEYRMKTFKGKGEMPKIGTWLCKAGGWTPVDSLDRDSFRPRAYSPAL